MPPGLADGGGRDHEEFHRTLRPRDFSDYIGQRAVVDQLEISVRAASARGDAMDHVLLHGPPGLGKTSLAAVLANELGVTMHISAGPLIPRTGDMVALLNALGPRDVLFVDEIHRLGPAVAEVLYPAMEDRYVNIMVGEKLGAHTLRIDLPPFTLIGATTRADLLTGPLRDRFPLVHQLEFYAAGDIQRVLERAAGVLGAPLSSEAAVEIASRSRGTPRVANNLLRRVRDWAQVKGSGTVDRNAALALLDVAQVDEEGLDRFDRKILESVLDNFAGGPVGLANLAATVGMDNRTLEEVHEPFMIFRGFLRRTARGRMITTRGARHLGREAALPAGTLFPAPGDSGDL